MPFAVAVLQRQADIFRAGIDVVVLRIQFVLRIKLPRDLDLACFRLCVEAHFERFNATKLCVEFEHFRVVLDISSFELVE